MKHIHFLLSLAAWATLNTCLVPLAVAQNQVSASPPAASAVNSTSEAAPQIISCWIKKGGPNPPATDYKYKWIGDTQNPDKPNCDGNGDKCAKICGIRNQGTIEPTGYGYILTVTLDATEYTRNDGAKSTGVALPPGTVLGPNECVVRIDQCPELPELESLQLDFKGIAVSETGTVSMIIPITR
ncbi:MAG: hypothetical protein FGM32_10690 [Candidatus Kapabacteria bacterium]|nr:hypothetical protein [Candidatus Kapabacteria bacterium]